MTAAEWFVWAMFGASMTAIGVVVAVASSRLGRRRD